MAFLYLLEIANFIVLYQAKKADCFTVIDFFPLYENRIK